MKEDLRSFLDQARAAGKVDSVGRFTLDATKAVEKLRRFRGLDAGVYLLKLVQSAVAAGAKTMEISIGAHSVRAGFALSEARLDTASKLMPVLSEARDLEDSALRHLGVALNAALEQPYQRLEWYTRNRD